MSLRLRGDRAIAQAGEAARAFGEVQQLPSDELARLCIVVEELIANIYDHGGVSDLDEVDLAFTRDPKGIRLSIVDTGTPFDPWSASPTTEAMERGGRAGVRLIQAWAEPIRYRTSGGGNHLELLLPIRRES